MIRQLTFYLSVISLSFYGTSQLNCINVIIVEELNVIPTLQLLQYVVTELAAVEQLHYIISYWYNGGGSSRYFNDPIH